MLKILRLSVEGFVRHFVLPFHYLRLAIYYPSRALSHPAGIFLVAVIVWFNHRTPHGHDTGGFVLTMIGYLIFIAMPARFLARLTQPSAPLPSVMPREAAWPSPARVILVVSPPSEDVSPSEAEMWARLDPLLQRIAKMPS